MNQLIINIENFRQKAIQITEPKNESDLAISIPFYEFHFTPNEEEISVAKETIIRLRGRRVLNSSECCDNCIERALESLNKIRYELVDLQVKLNDLESTLIAKRILFIKIFLLPKSRFLG